MHNARQPGKSALKIIVFVQTTTVLFTDEMKYPADIAS